MPGSHESERNPAETSPTVAAHFASKLGFSENTQSLDRMLSMPSVAFDVLSQSQRRYIIQYLLDNEPPVLIDDLARFVAACERQTSPAAITVGERNEIAARLIHVHLPKLVDFELIEWIPERGEILLYSGDQSSTEQYGKKERAESGSPVRKSDQSNT